MFLGMAIVLYAGIVFSTPTDPETLQRYSMTTVQARLINVSILLPFAIIWFLAFYGYIAFRDYARLIRKSHEGRAFAHIATGLAILATGLPLVTILSALTRLISQDRADFIPATTVLNHYANIAVTMFAFWYIHKGAHKLLRITKGQPYGRDWSLLLGSFVILALTYIYLVLTNPARNTNTPSFSGQSIFYLPDWLIVATIILPYMYIWYIGLVSGFYINFYQKKVGGVIYKEAFRYLALGLIAVILSSILRQYITATSNLLADLRLAPLLVLVYSLLIAIATGFVLIAIGARKLKHIEEV
jgi:hypothetical protein